LPDGKGLPLTGGTAGTEDDSNTDTASEVISAPVIDWLHQLNVLTAVDMGNITYINNDNLTANTGLQPENNAKANPVVVKNRVTTASFSATAGLPAIMLNQLNDTQQDQVKQEQPSAASSAQSDDALLDLHKVKSVSLPDTASSQLLLNHPSGGGEAFKLDATIPQVTPDRLTVTDMKPVDQQATHMATHDTPGPVKLTIDTPLQDGLWGQSLAGRITTMALNNQHTAQININPPELGPIEVKVTVSHDNQTSVNFFAHHTEVRDAIQDAIPRLRELFSNNGLTLGESNVSAHTFSHNQNGRPDGNTGLPGTNPRYETGPEEIPAPVVYSLSIGLIDHYV